MIKNTLLIGSILAVLLVGVTNTALAQVEEIGTHTTSYPPAIERVCLSASQVAGLGDYENLHATMDFNRLFYVPFTSDSDVIVSQVDNDGEPLATGGKLTAENCFEIRPRFGPSVDSTYAKLAEDYPDFLTSKVYIMGVAPPVPILHFAEAHDFVNLGYVAVTHTMIPSVTISKPGPLYAYLDSSETARATINLDDITDGSGLDITYAITGNPGSATLDDNILTLETTAGYTVVGFSATITTANGEQTAKSSLGFTTVTNPHQHGKTVVTAISGGSEIVDFYAPDGMTCTAEGISLTSSGTTYTGTFPTGDTTVECSEGLNGYTFDVSVIAPPSAIFHPGMVDDVRFQSSAETTTVSFPVPIAINTDYEPVSGVVCRAEGVELTLQKGSEGQDAASYEIRATGTSSQIAATLGETNDRLVIPLSEIFGSDYVKDPLPAVTGADHTAIRTQAADDTASPPTVDRLIVRYSPGSDNTFTVTGAYANDTSHVATVRVTVAGPITTSSHEVGDSVDSPAITATVGAQTSGPDRNVKLEIPLSELFGSDYVKDPLPAIAGADHSAIRVQEADDTADPATVDTLVIRHNASSSDNTFTVTASYPNGTASVLTATVVLDADLADPPSYQSDDPNTLTPVSVKLGNSDARQVVPLSEIFEAGYDPLPLVTESSHAGTRTASANASTGTSDRLIVRANDDGQFKVTASYADGSVHIALVNVVVGPFTASPSYDVGPSSRSSEITATLGTQDFRSDIRNNRLDIPLSEIFGSDYLRDPLPAITGADHTAIRIQTADDTATPPTVDRLTIRHNPDSNDNTFRVTASYADGTTHAIRVSVNADLALEDESGLEYQIDTGGLVTQISVTLGTQGAGSDTHNNRLFLPLSEIFGSDYVKDPLPAVAGADHSGIRIIQADDTADPATVDRLAIRHESSATENEFTVTATYANGTTHLATVTVTLDEDLTAEPEYEIGSPGRLITVNVPLEDESGRVVIPLSEIFGDNDYAALPVVTDNSHTGTRTAEASTSAGTPDRLIVRADADGQFQVTASYADGTTRIATINVGADVLLSGSTYTGDFGQGTTPVLCYTPIMAGKISDILFFDVIVEP